MSASAVLASVLVVAGGTGINQTGASTIEDVLSAAYRTNPTLLAARSKLKITDEGLAQAEANWRPTVSAQAAASFVSDQVSRANDIAAQAYLRSQYPGSSYGITVTQPIYRGGRTIAQLRQAKASVEEGESEASAVEQQVLLTVATDYLDVARDEYLLQLAEHRAADALKELEGARIKFAKGGATRLDEASAEAALQDALVARHSLESQQAVSKAAFLRDTGMYPGMFAFPAPLRHVPESVSVAMQVAGEQSFDVRQAVFALREAEQAVRVAEGQGLPSVSLQGSLLHQEGVTYPGEAEQIGALSIQVKIPIYSGGSIASQVRAAKASVEQKRYTLDATRRAAEGEAASAFARLENFTASEAALRAKSFAQGTYLQGVREQALHGERSVADVISAEVALFSVEAAAVQARHDMLVARYSLAAAVAEMTARGLALPVEPYDFKKYLHHILWGQER